MLWCCPVLGYLHQCSKLDKIKYFLASSQQGRLFADSMCLFTLHKREGAGELNRESIKKEKRSKCSNSLGRICKLCDWMDCTKFSYFSSRFDIIDTYIKSTTSNPIAKGFPKVVLSFIWASLASPSSELSLLLELLSEDELLDLDLAQQYYTIILWKPSTNINKYFDV